MPSLTNLSIFKGLPLLLQTRSSTWFITATVGTAIFTDVFLYAVIVPVFPFSLVTIIGVPEDEVQHWLSVLLAVYAAALLAGAPICGYLADRVKYRRWPLLLGLVSVAGATLMLCLARTLPLLIVGRVLQGLSASVIWVVGLALLSDTVGSDGLATAMGYVGAAYSLGTLIAPLLGGIVYDRSGYNAVFAMTFGVIALDIILRLTMIEKKAARQWLTEEELGTPNNEQTRREDRLAAQREVEDVDAINVVEDRPQPELEKSGAQQTVSTNKPKHRSPPIVFLWKSPRMLATFWGSLVCASLATGLDTTLTLFVNRTFGWNSQAAGILFLAILLPFMFAPIIGKFVDKYGSRWISVVGFLITIPPCILLRLVTHDTLNQKVLLAALLAIIGAGLALALGGLMAEFGKICDEMERADPGVFGSGGAYAQSYSIFNMSWAGGSLVGAFWSGGIYGAAGWGTVGWTWGLVCAVSVVPVLLYTDGWIGETFVGSWWRGRKEDKKGRAKVDTGADEGIRT